MDFKRVRNDMNTKGLFCFEQGHYFQCVAHSLEKRRWLGVLRSGFHVLVVGAWTLVSPLRGLGLMLGCFSQRRPSLKIGGQARWATLFRPYGTEFAQALAEQSAGKSLKTGLAAPPPRSPIISCM
jgi:hypothetical protein